MDFLTNIELFKKYKMSIIYIVMACILISVLLIIVLPKKYKSNGELSISVKYFQNPLIREIVTETYDSSELRALRESLILSAISDKFVDQIAAKYNFYDEKATAGSQELYYQRSQLRSRIVIIAKTPSVSEISFYSNNPKHSHDIVQAICDRIIEHLQQERQKFLANLRTSIKKSIDALIANIGYSVVLKENGGEFLKNPILNSQRDKLKTEIAEKLKFYSKNHPTIIKLYKELASIERDLGKLVEENQQTANNKAIEEGQARVKNMPIDESQPRSRTIPLLERDDQLLALNNANLMKGNNMVYEDLVRKFEYLNIAISNEEGESSSYMTILQSPSYPMNYVFPNKGFFVMWGLIAGFLLSCVYIALHEGFQLKRPLVKSENPSFDKVSVQLQALTNAQSPSPNGESYFS